MGSDLVRFSVSIERELLTRFMREARRRKFVNRSEAIRGLIRDSLVREEWAADQEIVGTITIVYDHHRRTLLDRLAEAQHDHHEAVLSTTHVHLDHDNCLEIIAVRGTAGKVQRVADAILGIKGLKHGKLTATTTGKRLV
jgi:CopG family nickel-responsive transcriptional regulator